MSRNRRGAVAVVTAVATPLVVGFAGLGVEVTSWQTNKRTLQTAADSAAGSGVIERAFGRDTNSIRAAALREAGRNGFATATVGDAIVNWPPASGPNTGNVNAVEVLLARPQRPMLAKAMFGSTVSIRARAVAMMRQTGDACVLALDPSAPASVTNTGSTTVNLPGCIVASNSNSDSAIDVWGSATLTAQSLYSVGGYVRGGSSTMTLAQPPATRMWSVPDPFAGTPIPTPGSCSHSGKRIDKDTTTLNPGTYCNGIAIGAGSVVTMNPGVYIINRGDFAVNGTAEVTCNCTGGQGVTIILTSSTTASQIGRVFINGGAKVNLSAPSDPGSPYRGMLFVQDSRVPSGGASASNRLNGGANMILKGALYFPGAEVQWSGNNTASNCTQLVSRTVTFTGNSRLEVSGCEAAGVDQVRITSAQLVE